MQNAGFYHLLTFLFGMIYSCHHAPQDIKALRRRGLGCTPRSCLLRLLGQVSHVLSVTPDNAGMREYRRWLLDELKKTQ